ncbi:hypothetical protein [Patulibacter sp. SYSU D01012]|uniref:hypothetical protein n=1 Tax=Patulibacter sp. SYSU D01012 TaxID=2817381 RepID=UPI001B312A04|nr:hypothetical protein [Patulibacter sp. SYSU D01012]
MRRLIVLLVLAATAASVPTAATAAPTPAYASPDALPAAPPARSAEGVSSERVGPAAVVAMVAVRAAVRTVLRRRAVLRSKTRRVARPAVRPKLNARTFARLFSESRRLVRWNRDLLKLRWGGLGPATQGCVAGIVVSRLGTIPADGDLPPWVSFYTHVNEELAKIQKPFSGIDLPGLADASALAAEFHDQGMAALGACAAGASSGFRFNPPPGL